MRLIRITSRAQLGLCIDDICEMCTQMIRRTGSHGQTPESLVGMMTSLVQKPTSFLVVVADEIRLQGFAFALINPVKPPVAEVVAIYGRPGVGVKFRDEAYAMLKEWAKSHGATRIMAMITRSPEKFFKFFHAPLGFKPIGWIVEAEIGDR